MTTRREREQQVVVEGRVIADFGREFLVELADKRPIVCTPTGTKPAPTLRVGRSGMARSKTVNALAPSDVARVGDLTVSRDSGAHTTTFSRFYRLDKDTAIIDTPGFQSFGLFHLTEDQIGEAMREFRPFLGRCKFNDCAHLEEPGCAIMDAAGRGEIGPEPLSFYQVLIHQHPQLHDPHPQCK